MKQFCKDLKISSGKSEITLSDAISLDVPFSSPLPLHDLPSYMLRRIMLLDVSSRVLPNLSTGQVLESSSRNANTSPLSTFLDEDDEDEIVHPMDVFLYLFLKSHPTFRQTLVNQVSKCQLSLPLITYESDSGQVTLNHFAFQTLILSRYVDGEDSKAFLAVEEPLPIVSFMRVGDCENSQKSEFLNRILKIKHEYFFHKDCRGNTSRRYLLNGTVEIAWSLAKAKRNSIITHHYIMLNLRGNACNFPKQRQFLGQISDIVYVFVPLSELTQNMAQILVEIHDGFKAQVIFLIYKGTSNRNPSPETIPNILNDKDKTIGLKKKNICQNQELIEKSIAHSLTENKHRTPITLTDCTGIALRLGILCDSQNKELSSAKNIIESVCRAFKQLADPNFLCTASLGDLKIQLLPLQARFEDWAQANRDMQQLGNRGEFDEYNRNVEDEQLKARAFQVDLLSKPTTLLSEILKQCNLFSKDKDKNKYGFFIFWEILKNYLNTLSRKHLPMLYAEYKRWLIESYSVHPTSEDTDARDALQKQARDKLLKAANRITLSSFGIEHIFREIGQVYEAFHSIRQSSKKTFCKNQLSYRPTLLPSIMAHLILKGHSFEIVNGDVNHVPLQWVSDVLNALSEIIGADKKIFVISVLGVQSSGKSTLLNSMFGINFPVSSGRCTRGVFMQMIEVKKSLRKELGYDYLVVLDTEGLRAPELSGSLSYKRDNEMATFIVGLGDISLINIKGESHSEVQDILEITVIAFIRMQLSYSKPKCFFVHQNVGDIQARTNLIIARKNLIDTLNEMTYCAAQQENKKMKFSQFCDVIEFNPEEDVFYFPGLFEGEPPMTSISPGYVENAEMLRDKLIACCSEERRSFLNMKLWRKKLSNLWNSVLNENFVFSYRNILELNCRVELDISLCSWYSFFTQEMAILKSESFNQLYNVETSQIQEKFENILEELFDTTQNLYSDKENSIMDFYFAQHEKKECFQQWNSQTRRYFKSCRDREYRKVKEECEMISRVERQKEIIDKNFAICRKDIVAKVRQLYENNEKNVSFESEESVQIYFYEIWNDMKSNIQLTNPEEVNIPRDLQHVLVEIPHLQKLDVIPDKKAIIKEVSKYEEFGTSEFEDMVQIYGEANTDYSYYEIIDVQKHKLTYGDKVKSFFSNIFFHKEDKTKNSVPSKIQLIIQNLDNQMIDILNKFPQNSNYCIDYFRVLIDECVKAISEQNKTEKTNALQSLVLTNNFIFDFVFYQCCKAIKKFEMLYENYLEQNSLEVKLFHLETILKHSFTQLCAGIHSEDLCAQLLMEITLDGMKRFLEDTILQLLQKLFVNDPEHSTVYTSRASLQLAVLKELAKKKDFHSYIRYINFPFDYINCFIERNIIEYSRKPSVLNNILTAIDIKVKDFIGKFIQAAQFEPTKGENSWEDWKQHYHNSITNIVRGVKLSDLDILDVHSVNNYKQFPDLFKVAIENHCKKFNWKEWIINTLAGCNFNDLRKCIADPLIECRALCPFCREPCQLTAGEHDHYCGSFHRPQGLNGWHYIRSNIICIEDCSTSLQMNRRFRYKNIFYKYTDYRTVDDIFKSWNIIGQDALDSKYWQWVLYMFQKEFVTLYGIEQNNEIEQNLSQLTEEEVIEDIEKHYQNYIFKTI